MGLIDNALAGVGKAFAKAGDGLLMAGNYAWGAAGESIVSYITLNPTTDDAKIAGWSVVSSSYAIMQGLAASLVAVFFLAGWCRESIDIRQNFNLENNFKFFIRFILAVGLVTNGLDLIVELIAFSCALTLQVSGGSLTGMTSILEGNFASTMESVTGGEALVMGLVYFVGGIVGVAITFVCAIKILISVFGRFYRMFLVIPLAPVAFSTFAGGGELSGTGKAWIKTFFGYLLEVVVIALALQLCHKMFGNISFFGSEIETEDGWVGIIVKSVLVIVERIMPVTLTTTCVGSAESVIRKCLGLNT